MISVGIMLAVTAFTASPDGIVCDHKTMKWDVLPKIFSRGICTFVVAGKEMNVPRSVRITTSPENGKIVIEELDVATTAERNGLTEGLEHDSANTGPKCTFYDEKGAVVTLFGEKNTYYFENMYLGGNKPKALFLECAGKRVCLMEMSQEGISRILYDPIGGQCLIVKNVFEVDPDYYLYYNMKTAERIVARIQETRDDLWFMSERMSMYLWLWNGSPYVVYPVRQSNIPERSCSFKIGLASPYGKPLCVLDMEPAIDLEGTQVYTNGNLAIVRLGEGTIHVYALCPAGKK